MDKTALVRSDQEIEGLIMEALSRIKMPVTLLGWNSVSELDEAELVIATPWYDLKGPLETYDAAIEAFQKAGIYKKVPMLRVSFKSPNDSVVKTLERETSDEREGAIHVLRHGGPHDGGGYSVVFAPYLGPGGAVPARRFSRVEDLREFLLRTLRLGSRSVDDALEELAHRGSASIRPVSLKVRELKRAGLV